MDNELHATVLLFVCLSISHRLFLEQPSYLIIILKKKQFNNKAMCHLACFLYQREGVKTLSVTHS